MHVPCLQLDESSALIKFKQEEQIKNIVLYQSINAITTETTTNKLYNIDHELIKVLILFSKNVFVYYCNATI